VKDLMVRHRIPAPGQPQFFAGSLNRLPPADVEHLPRKKDGSINAYSLGLAAQNCAHYTLTELRKAFRSCAEANLQMVTTQTAEDVVLTRLLTGIMARSS
jgi:DNA polymerase-3 subunit delta